MKSFSEILAENPDATLFVVTIGSAQSIQEEIAEVTQMLLGLPSKLLRKKPRF